MALLGVDMLNCVQSELSPRVFNVTVMILLEM
jgi:hypothetical protein